MEGGGVTPTVYAKLHVSISECIIVFLSKRYMPPPLFCDFVTLKLYESALIYIFSNGKVRFLLFPLWKTIAMDWLKRNLLFSKFITGTYVKGDLFLFAESRVLPW